jgi:sulfonate transport system ATP-binding protein
MTLLEFDRVSRDFVTPDGRGYRALEDISLEITAGAFVAIVGPSGCGKSTLLNLAAGLLPPTSGQVRASGAELTGLNRGATYMFQQDALLPWKNVRENVALGLVLAGVARADAHRRADSWLARVGLAEFATHYPSQLSGGMRKRVTMAQNWIIERGLMLMDEPFSALDVHTRQRMETELLALWEEATADAVGAEPSPAGRPFQGRRDGGAEPPPPRLRRSTEAFGESGSPAPRQSPRLKKTVLFVTHDLEEAIALADEVVVLSAGPASRIVARHPVTLDRPRDLMELRTSAAFIDLYRAVWAVLREEVVKSRQRARARGLEANA